MEILLQGKKALKGGASRGLGKAIAMQLAECGAEEAPMGITVNNILTDFFDTKDRMK